MEQHKNESLQVLEDIKQMMNRSSRVLSLSGWSGIWAGAVALIGSALAYQKHEAIKDFNKPELMGFVDYFVFLALATLLVAVLGAFYFSYRKNKQQGQATFNAAAQKMIVSMCIPMLAGAVLCFNFIMNYDWQYLVPTMLIIYGLTLINSAKYTISDIKWLGLLEVIIGAIALWFPTYGLYFWAFGFGILHIVYGFIMWNKYDRRGA